MAQQNTKLNWPDQQVRSPLAPRLASQHRAAVYAPDQQAGFPALLLLLLRRLGCAAPAVRSLQSAWCVSLHPPFAV